MGDQVIERFEEFRRRFLEQGSADPRAALDGLEGEARAELSLLIEHFLIEAPRRPWDEEEFRSSGAARVAERVMAAFAEAPEAEAERLKDLRDGAELARDALVGRLAGLLAVPGEDERVGYYYHHLEQGTLPLAGISGRVFEALAEILQVGVERLRRAAENSQREPGPGEPVFARSVTGTRANLDPVEADEVQPSPPGSPGEVDRLFTGG